MKLQPALIVLTVVNFLLLLLNLTQTRAFTAPAVAPLVQTRVLEVLDDRGVVRTQIKVEAEGEVVLRQFDQTGTIRVKLGAGRDGSGLLLADETAEVGVHILARRNPTAARPNTTGITMVGTGGVQHVIRP